WLAAALLALALGTAGEARAQHLPQGPGPAPLPEPAPVGGPSPNCGSPAIPGPLNPVMAPRGPSPDLSLHPKAHSAFEDAAYTPETGCSFPTGARALQRQRPGPLPIALLDPQNRTADPFIGGEVQTVPSRHQPVILDVHDVDLNFAW